MSTPPFCGNESSKWKCRALVMAGGRSERMRASTGIHKALIQVGGIALIDRNLQALYNQGFLDVVVAVGAHSPEIEECIAARRQQWGSAGLSLTCLHETIPLGTIGAARLAVLGFDAVVVVNVDNLTTLPLRKVAEFHRDSHAALTIASHSEPFRIPFGQLIIRGSEVLEYREKPIIPVVISSGTYAVSAGAATLIPPDGKFDITQLFTAVKAKGLRVAAFEHECAWVDVNDEAARRKAEECFA